MLEATNLDQMAADIRAAAADCGAYVVEAIVSIENGIPTVAVDGSEFPDLIRHVRPHIVYLTTSSFDAQNELLAVLEVDDEDFVRRPSAEKLISPWLRHNGETSRVVIGMTCGGVFHGTIEAAEWLADFESEAQTLLEEALQFERDGRHIAEAAERQRLEPFVKQLQKDARYSGPKVGIAKRTALATALFPELDQVAIKLVVERAEMAHWLATAR